MLLARTLGLSAVYWAGISAIVVSTGTPGGSFASSLARAEGTLLGLACGLGAVELLGHTLTAAALAILVSILLCRTFGLKDAIKVCALTTLFPINLGADRQGLGPALEVAMVRVENVLVGCAVTMVLDGLIWPERVSRKFQNLLRVQIGRAGSLAAALIDAYASLAPVRLEADLAILQQARVDQLQMLRAVAEEPEDPLAPKAWLSQRMAWVHELVDHCGALHAILLRVDGDRVQGLVRKELAALAESIRTAGLALERGNPEPQVVETLALVRERLEAAFEGVRGERGTAAYPVPEVFRLLGVLMLGGVLAEGLARLAEHSAARFTQEL
jgi:uncharacterized membrane protein YccC